MKKRLLSRAMPVIAAPALALVALLLTLLLLSRGTVSATPGEADAVPKVRAQDTFVVSGNIICGATGSISDVKVHVSDQPTGTSVLSDTTDVNGAYSVALAEGSYDFDYYPPTALGLNARAFTSIQLVTDIVLDMNFCVCRGTWVTETVDSVGNVGTHTSLALAPTYPYTPHISHYNRPSNSLKHAWLSGSVWLSETVDHGGRSTSLALAPTFPYSPCISYYDNSGSGPSLRYACLGSTTWITMGIGRSWEGKNGTSLALEPIYPYTPHVSYYRPIAVDNYLGHTYLSGTAWCSGTWDAEVVELGPVGAFSSLALEPTYPYTPHISYRAGEPLYDLKHAWLSGTIWLQETVDSAGDVGRLTSLALDSGNNPHISYQDNTNGTLKHAWLSGTVWLSETVDSIGDLVYAGTTSIELDQTDAIYISYYGATDGDLRLARFDGKIWIIQTVDSIGNVGQYSSLALDQCGCPHISYYDATNGNLKYAYIAARPYGIYLPLVLRQFP